MNTKVSTKGQVVLPSPVRRRLGIQAGDALDIHIEEGRVVLTPRKRGSGQARMTNDPITGLPVLSAGPDAPVLTSKQVEEMLSDFP